MTAAATHRGKLEEEMATRMRWPALKMYEVLHTSTWQACKATALVQSGPGSGVGCVARATRARPSASGAMTRPRFQLATYLDAVNVARREERGLGGRVGPLHARNACCNKGEQVGLDILGSRRPHSPPR